MKRIIQYLGDCKAEIAKVSKQSHCSRFYHWMDYIGCYIRHGAHIHQYSSGDFWRYSGPERKLRMTYGRMCKLMKRLDDEEYIPVLKNKTKFNEYFKEFVKRDWLDISTSDYDTYLQFVQKHKTVIVKPVGGIAGNGISKFTLDEQIDEKELHKMFNDLQKSGALVEECIVPHPQMVFGNTSVNTIRAYTLIGKDKKAHVLKTLLRAGVGDTAADNYHLGGSIYEVDAATGVINSYGQLQKGSHHFKHPGTDIVMLGYQVPRWGEVLDLCVKAAEQLPQIGIIGWDIAIMPDGVQLIEGNHNPDYELFEFIGTPRYYQRIKELID